MKVKIAIIADSLSEENLYLRFLTSVRNDTILFCLGLSFRFRGNDSTKLRL